MENTIIQIDELYKAIKDATIDSRIDLARKYIIHGIPFVFLENPDSYYEFRKKIANHFHISYRDVYIVGSAKLGYSYRKKTIFSLNSDIDVAIVSKELFDSYQRELCQFQYQFERSHIRLTNEEYGEYISFLKYIAKGWWRPDKVPTKLNLAKWQDVWFDYFKSLSHGKSEVGNYEVTAGLYKDYYSLETYIVNSFNSIKYEDK